VSTTKLRELAHSRTGDKGDTSNISVIAFRPEDYPRLLEALTVERVAAHFAELPGILKGGVTRSLALDAHGKALGSALLDIEV
jgi:hypothetical protein